MDIKANLTTLSFIVITYSATGAHAHNAPLPHHHSDATQLAAISVEEKTGQSSGWDVYGEKFRAPSNNYPEVYSHYQIMSGQASQNGTSPIRTEIRDSLHWHARVKFSGHDTINDIKFTCTVKDNSPIYDTAVHAAINFKDGAKITVMTRKPIDQDITAEGFEYKKGECFFVRLSK